MTPDFFGRLPHGHQFAVRRRGEGMDEFDERAAASALLATRSAAPVIAPVGPPVRQMHRVVSRDPTMGPVRRFRHPQVDASSDTRGATGAPPCRSANAGRRTHTAGPRCAPRDQVYSR
ncbi:MAG: hypothetical protein QOK12_586 [Mycobacterium sp.]|nr:hypothetical protein [Mycobacterium sp.]